VDDCGADTVASLRRQLTLWGHDCRGSRNGREALVSAGAYRSDVAVLDLCLAGLRGYELGRRLGDLSGPEADACGGSKPASSGLRGIAILPPSSGHEPWGPSIPRRRDFSINDRCSFSALPGRPRPVPQWNMQQEHA